jgi:hypothetical protein
MEAGKEGHGVEETRGERKTLGLKDVPPVFLVSVASKGLRQAVSLLFATLTAPRFNSLTLLGHPSFLESKDETYGTAVLHKIERWW